MFSNIIRCLRTEHTLIRRECAQKDKHDWRRLLHCKLKINTNIKTARRVQSRKKRKKLTTRRSSFQRNRFDTNIPPSVRRTDAVSVVAVCQFHCERFNCWDYWHENWWNFHSASVCRAPGRPSTPMPSGTFAISLKCRCTVTARRRCRRRQQIIVKENLMFLDKIVNSFARWLASRLSDGGETQPP